MKSLIFGATGYLGQHLTNCLHQSGHRVIIPLTSAGNRIDLTDPDALMNLDWDVDTVFMYAGITGTKASFKQYSQYLAANELSLLNILNAISQSNMRPRVIFPSTRLIYYGSDNLLTESSVQQAKTVYAVNKIACEYYLQAYANAFNIPYTIIRVCVPYANLTSGQYSYGTIGNFIHQARETGNIRLYDGGCVRRTFTHILDICRLTLLAAENQSTVNQTYNLPGENKSLYEAATQIANRFNAQLESVECPEFDRRIESGSTVFDGNKLLTVLNTRLNYRFDNWVEGIPV